MKRIKLKVAAICMMMFVLAAGHITAFADSYTRPDTGYVVVSAATTLNVRSGPGMQYRRIASIPDCSVFHVNQVQEYWAQIASGRYSGNWICRGYTSYVDFGREGAHVVKVNTRNYLTTRIWPSIAFAETGDISATLKCPRVWGFLIRIPE